MADVTYVWDPIEDNVIRERDENGNTIVNYTTEPTLYGAVLSQDRGGQVRHYHFDGQGNTTELTDENGNVTDTRKYSAFGEATESTGTTEFPYQWGGRWGYLQARVWRRAFLGAYNGSACGEDRRVGDRQLGRVQMGRAQLGRICTPVLGCPCAQRRRNVVSEAALEKGE